MQAADVLGGQQVGARISSRSMALGAASSRIQPESRSSSQAALSMRATTISEAIASAWVQPVARMMTRRRRYR